MNRRYSLLLILLFSKLHLSAAGEAALSFLNTPVFPDVAAQGESASTLVGRLSSLDSNPAGLAHLRRPVTSILHSSQFDGTRQNVVAYGRQTRRGAWAMAGTRRAWAAGNRTRVSSTPGELFVEEGSIDAESLGFQAAYGRRIHRDVAVGGGFRYVHQELDDRSLSGFLADVGVIYRIDLDRRVSFVLNNAGYVRNSGGASVKAPTRLRTGYYYSSNEWLGWTLDLGHAWDGSTDAHLGVEADWLETGFFRVGYHYRFDRPDLSVLAGATAGVGIQWKNFLFDYAFLPFDDLGDSHRVALSWVWGPPPKQRAAPRPRIKKSFFTRDER